MARRRVADSAVLDYRARIHYRLTFGVGRRRWARVPTSAVEEQVADIQWQRPNDLRIDVRGRRSRSRSEDVELSSVWDRPWFVPRSVDDSVRIFSDEFPATGALHPLAAAAPAWYRYTLGEALSVTPGTGGTLRLFQVQVTPRRKGLALIAGEMWIDSASAEVVRLSFRYVGTGLWVLPEGEKRSDTASARRINSIANQLVSVDADLEYGLQDRRYWMPFRQVISRPGEDSAGERSGDPFPRGRPRSTTSRSTPGGRSPSSWPLGPDDPDSVEATARGSGFPPAAGIGAPPDGALRSWDYADRWPGGRYELHRPPNASLDRYRGWLDSLSLEGDPADLARARDVESDLARLAESLPDSVTGQRWHGFGYERLTDAFRYDRVQGISLGLGYRVPGAGPRVHQPLRHRAVRLQ